MINWLLRKAMPLIKWFTTKHLPYTHKEVSGRHYYFLRDKLRVGDVLLSAIKGEFSNILNPEELPHAAMFVGDVKGTGVLYVIEATRHGVVFTDLVTFLTSKDLVVVSRYYGYSDKNDEKFQKVAGSYIGIPYDYTFTDSDDKLYCFELVAKIYEEIDPMVDLDMTEVALGKYTYSHELFYESVDFYTKYDTRNMIC